MKRLFLPLCAVSWLAAAFSAYAEPADESFPKPWQLGFQTPASPVMERLYTMHDYLLWMCVIISLFVLALTLYICVRFSRRNNPVPSKTTHNTTIEVIWTVVPIIILIAIAIPSLRLHYFMEHNPAPDMTLKIVGNQWYWHYEYPDHGDISFDSNIKADKELKEGEHRLLAVDNHVVVPVDTNVRVLLTAADVIHAWAMPALGVKRDAVPGRLNETWFKATKVGRYYGQCSELCGVRHGFMPIVLDVVSKEDFAKWVKEKQKGGAAAEPEKEAAKEPVKEAEAPAPEKPKPAKEKEKKPVEKKEKKKPEPKPEDSEEESAPEPEKTNDDEAQE